MVQIFVSLWLLEMSYWIALKLKFVTFLLNHYFFKYMFIYILKYLYNPVGVDLFVDFWNLMFRKVISKCRGNNINYGQWCRNVLKLIINDISCQWKKLGIITSLTTRTGRGIQKHPVKAKQIVGEQIQNKAIHLEEKDWFKPFEKAY